MSTAKRRRGHSLHLDLPAGQFEDVPPVAAVFLVLFDIKAGYTIAWKRSIPDVELSESVEFKSLPSGLHNVHEDLIYYVHGDEYAGISAFINEPAANSDRNVLMLAVGALVPLSQGRLGKIWKHAAALKELASALVQDISHTQLLEEFWAHHQQPITNDLSSESESQVESPSTDRVKRREGKNAPNGHSRPRDRVVSTASAMPSGSSLTPYHPALSLPTFLDTFGPLIFPIYKAALLRKRILLVGQAPVELACNFVYHISILSGIPSSVSDFLPLEPLPTRLRPLFSVGIHDMHSLGLRSRDDGKPKQSVTEDGMDFGWVACTTDDILSTKEHLFHVLVTMPARYTHQAHEKAWPRMEKRGGMEIRATQRDLRRYQTLRRELRRYACHRLRSPHSGGGYQDEERLVLPIENRQETFDEASSTIDEKLIEPQSWSALAYSSFMWWASAGEQRADLDEETEHDSALLHGPGYHGEASPTRRQSSWVSPGMPSTEDTPAAGLEMAVIAYFHRLTALILRTLADIVEAAEDIEDEEQVGADPGHAEAVYVTSEDMARMGLDIWSEEDRQFVKELVGLYWGRKAEVQGARVECCGVRIC